AVVEQGEDAVVLLLRDRVELVVVALAAVEREPEPDGAGGRDPVVDGVPAELQRVGPALLVQHRVAMEAGRDFLVQVRPGQHVAGELLDCELVERLVVIQGADDPVAVEPHGPRAVLFVAVRVRVPGQVEPSAGPPGRRTGGPGVRGKGATRAAGPGAARTRPASGR